MGDVEMRCDPETGEPYYLRQVDADHAQVLDAHELATARWAAPQHAVALRAPAAEFDLNFEDAVDRPRAG
jgi:hypothetical protein